MQHIREISFSSTNIDLIYGLPKQTEKTFAWTIDKILQLSPDCLSMFNYAYLPYLFAEQRKIQ